MFGNAITHQRWSLVRYVIANCTLQVDVGSFIVGLISLVRYAIANGILQVDIVMLALLLLG
jgi:hypothetical protein